MVEGIKTRCKIDADYYFPMIDARRNEVFGAIINNSGEFIQNGKSLVLDEEFSTDLPNGKGLVFGSGAQKATPILGNQVSYNTSYELNAKDLIKLAYKKFVKQEFSNLAYFEPNYLKPVYITKTTQKSLI